MSGPGQRFDTDGNLRVTSSGGSTSISGTVATTNTALQTAIGTTADAAWDGVAATATVISLLKKIALNTTPTP
jgi:hypothetical protein